RGGLAGAVVFSFTDEWFKYGKLVEDWQMGLTTRDRQPKESYWVVQDRFGGALLDSTATNDSGAGARPSPGAAMPGKGSGMDRPGASAPAPEALGRRDALPYSGGTSVHFGAAPYFTLPRYPKVSVIVVCYNGERTLRACLDSLQRLNYPDYEVILVDDG